MTDETQTPQTEAGAGQTAPAQTESKYTKADIDAAVEKARSAWTEKFERKESALKKAHEGLAASQARVAELEKFANSYSDTESAKAIKKLETELADARGKAASLRTGLVSREVASALSVDPDLASTLITGLRSQGVLDEEPEDPAEAAKVWAEKLREKHGDHFGKQPDTAADKKKRRGVIPNEGTGRPSHAQAVEERRRKNAAAGGPKLVL